MVSCTQDDPAAVSEGLGNGAGSATYSGFRLWVGGELSLICSLSMGAEDGVGGPEQMPGVTCWGREGVVGEGSVLSVRGVRRKQVADTAGTAVWLAAIDTQNKTKRFQVTINKLEDSITDLTRYSTPSDCSSASTLFFFFIHTCIQPI